jgi:uncharacterized membrane protein
MKTLIAGESWVTHSTHVKGFDSFTTSHYEEGVGWLKAALEAAGSVVDYLPNHEASERFPSTAADLASYDVVILSDIGANTLLLAPETFSRSQSRPNRLLSIAEYVRSGGGLVMVGGYLTFQGIDGKARYHGTPVEDVLPVTMSQVDDRVEAPEGAIPRVTRPDHPVVAGLDPEWPAVLGYNRVETRETAALLVEVGTDPLVAVREIDAGRSLAFTTDCGPHWAPPPFVNWDGYARFWAQAVAWLARADG